MVSFQRLSDKNDRSLWHFFSFRQQNKTELPSIKVDAHCSRHSISFMTLCGLSKLHHLAIELRAKKRHIGKLKHTTHFYRNFSHFAAICQFGVGKKFLCVLPTETQVEKFLVFLPKNITSKWQRIQFTCKRKCLKYANFPLLKNVVFRRREKYSLGNKERLRWCLVRRFSVTKLSWTGSEN